MKQVTVGFFNLPGISFDKDEMTEDLEQAMIAWVDETKCGIYMKERLWSFKNEGQRDFFLIRWAEMIPTKKED